MRLFEWLSQLHVTTDVLAYIAYKHMCLCMPWQLPANAIGSKAVVACDKLRCTPVAAAAAGAISCFGRLLLIRVCLLGLWRPAAA
jgi:hypothetical protein